MTAAFAIELDGLGLGTAVRDGNIFRFHAAEAALFGLEKFKFVSLGDVVTAARRSHALQHPPTTPARRSVEISRRTALARWQGLH